MDLGRILKWVVIAAVLFVAWKVVMPWVAKIRTGGSPPGDVVQRQESVDSKISDAAELVRAGK